MEDAQFLGEFFFTVALDGVNYKFQFQYNEREDFWYFNILDIEDNLIRTGLKVVSNWSLLRLMRGEIRPPGDLISVDTRDTPLDPHLENLGIESLFSYLEEGSEP